MNTFSSRVWFEGLLAHFSSCLAQPCCPHAPAGGTDGNQWTYMFSDGRDPSVRHVVWRQRSANLMQVVEKKSVRTVKDLAVECDQDNLFALWNSMPSVIHRASVFLQLYALEGYNLTGSPHFHELPCDEQEVHPRRVPDSLLVFLGWASEILRLWPATEHKTRLEEIHRIPSLKVTGFELNQTI